ncbi:hypothetical protein E2C01_039184 [Portunus trituberculatus]|uniref:Uncharacterized protein n=1 Tax=Portunus trituberculatus TaxID=210409 RepID=A0A5B7FIZ8_PORTR|nr:hypothetical protein [Portunus trituberculatus]
MWTNKSAAVVRSSIMFLCVPARRGESSCRDVWLEGVPSIRLSLEGSAPVTSLDTKPLHLALPVSESPPVHMNRLTWFGSFPPHITVTTSHHE